MHLISDLNETGVNDKIFLDLKRHNARIKRLTNRMRKPAGPIAQLAMKSRGLGKTGTSSKMEYNQSQRYHRKHSPKGNKIIRSNGRNFNDSSPQYNDENLENNSNFIFTNGIMIEPRGHVNGNYARSTRFYHRQNQNNNPIEFV